MLDFCAYIRQTLVFADDYIVYRNIQTPEKQVGMIRKYHNHTL